MVTVKEHPLLWNKIQDFRLDEEYAVITFSDKLSTQQKWSPAFTKTAIEEYRKFIFLCCIAEKGASPSYIVDQVWHLHLTYTKSYWVDFCKNTLGREIHHHPSTGGDAENHKHEEWYKDTLALYEKVFGMAPPADIWPRPVPVIAFSLPFVKRLPAYIAFVLLLLLIYIFIGFDGLFIITGPDFVPLFAIMATLITGCYIFTRTREQKAVQAVTEKYFPNDVTPFQVAGFLYGKHRAMQAAIVGLVQRGLLQLVGHRFVVCNTRYIPPEKEFNPLVPDVLKDRDETSYNYREMMNEWYDSTKFSHPGLDALQVFASRRAPIWQTYPYFILLYGIGLTRLARGLLHERPSGYLIVELFISTIVFIIVARHFSRKQFVHKKVKALYRDRIDGRYHETVPAFVLNGPSAIQGLSEGPSLMAIFGVYGSSWSFLNRGSGDGGSSCGSSGGCGGGGGGCGGGGCGGCGSS